LLQLVDSSANGFIAEDNKNVLRKFQEYCLAAGIHDMADVTIERLDAYRAARMISRITSQKELETLRQSFAICVERKWTDDDQAQFR